jgi:hypothetical protein
MRPMSSTDREMRFVCGLQIARYTMIASLLTRCRG